MVHPFGFAYPTHPFAVIDIGSNSVRMVIYHSLCRVPMPLYNEKYYCGLARHMSESGKLHPEGVKLARKALARFARLLQRFGVVDLRVLATAAIRDAADGEAFARRIRLDTGLPVEIITGEAEAELAAYGILASLFAPQGIIADLGGGSVELALVNGQNIASRTSLPLGTLRLQSLRESKKTSWQRSIAKDIRGIDWLGEASGQTLYAVGGSFRAMAKMHMRRHRYPLPLVDGYTLSARAAMQMLRELQALREDEIAELPGIAEDRVATIRPAACLLQQLMQQTNAAHISFSVSGIREGLLYDCLPTREKKEDPLIASAMELGALAGRRGRYAKELFGWMQPLFPSESEARARLRLALCHVSELAWTIDPNFRAEWAYLRVLQSAIKGITHRERVMLSMALYHRYQNKWRLDRPELALVEEEDAVWAKAVGLAANLAFQLSGGRHGSLHHATLSLKRRRIHLTLDAEASPLRTETVENRLEGLGSICNALWSFDL